MLRRGLRRRGSLPGAASPDVQADDSDERSFAGTLLIYPEGGGPAGPKEVDAERVLYLELSDEGADTGKGTMVEVPDPAFHDYFGVGEGSELWLTVRSAAGAKQLVRLRRMGDEPPRVRLPFVRSSPPGPARRAVVRFERTGRNAYRVDHRTRDQEGYVAWLTRCSQNAHRLDVRWGLAQV